MKTEEKEMKRNVIRSLLLLVLMTIIGTFIYFQHGRDSRIVTSYKNSHGSTSVLAGVASCAVKSLTISKERRKRA